MIIEGNFVNKSESKIKQNNNIVKNVSFKTITIDESVERSIISGTKDYCDIIPVLLLELEGTKDYNILMQKLGKIVNFDISKDNPKWLSSEVSTFYLELESSLNVYAPEGCYFGAHPEDNSNLGYWKY